MAAKLIESNRKNAEIYTRHEQCNQKLTELMTEINIPPGLFHLADIQEFGHNKSTGFMWVIQKKPVKHKFKKMNQLVSYDTHMTAFVESGQLKKIHGLKLKQLMFWLTLSDVFIDDPCSGKITICSAGVSKDLALSLFEDEDEDDA